MGKPILYFHMCLDHSKSQEHYTDVYRFEHQTGCVLQRMFQFLCSRSVRLISLIAALSSNGALFVG